MREGFESCKNVRKECFLRGWRALIEGRIWEQFSRVPVDAMSSGIVHRVLVENSFRNGIAASEVVL